MRRTVALSAIVFIVGCGEGPRHLPKADYQHGKAAFEMLQQYERTSSDSFEKSAQLQIEAIDPKNIDDGLMPALINYEISLSEMYTASLGIQTGQLARQRIVLNAELGKRDTNEDIRQQAEKAYAAKRAYEDIQPIVKLCRDDAAQYFDASAASTNSCDGELTAYRAKRDLKKPKLKCLRNCRNCLAPKFMAKQYASSGPPASSHGRSPRTG